MHLVCVCHKWHSFFFFFLTKGIFVFLQCTILHFFKLVIYLERLLWMCICGFVYELLSVKMVDTNAVHYNHKYTHILTQISALKVTNKMHLWLSTSNILHFCFVDWITEAFSAHVSTRILYPSIFKNISEI